jgi:hypothetical protein
MTQGFSRPTAVSDDAAADLESQAILVEEIKVDSIEYGTYSPQELPELPIGVFTPGKEGNPSERLQTYEVIDNIDSGKYYSLLGSLQEERNLNTQRVITIGAKFLAATIKTIGGRPVKEVASICGKDLVGFFENMWMADVLTLMLGLRLAALETFDYAVNTKCGCTENQDLVYGPSEREYSLSSVEIKNLLLTEDKKRPLFLIKLPKPISDGESQIDQLFVEPMRWRHLADITSKDKGTDIFLRQAIQTIVAIPQSTIYGKTRGKPFCMELFAPMGSKSRKALSSGMNALQFGPEMTRQLYCYHCDRNTDWQFPWVLMRDFVYDSDDYRQEQRT